MVQVGRTLALVTENNASQAADLHLFDAATLAHQAAIRVLRPGHRDPPLARLGADILLSQRRMVVLRPATEPAALAARLAYVEAIPWEFSNGNHLVDANPGTTFAVPAYATVSLVFPQPTLLSQLTLLVGKGSKAGQLASVQVRESPCENKPVPVPPGSRRVHVLPAPVLAEKVVLELRCASPDRTVRDPQCEVAEIEFNPSP
jgi:hypothetical protein